MENSTTVRFEIEVAAQRVISQYMISNSRVEKELQEAVKEAFENFDFKSVVKETIVTCIEKAIKESADWGKIRTSVREKADSIVEQYIDKSLERFREDFAKDLGVK